MAAKVGIWIDHEQAVVVLITETGPQIKKITSETERPARAAGGSRLKHKYTPNDFVAEDRRQRKSASVQKHTFEEALNYVRGADSLWILGPGEAKSEFHQYIKSRKLRGLPVELATSDKLTDRQITAAVMKHFAPPATAKTSSSSTKKSASTKTSTSAPAKRATVHAQRAKKSGK
jgi:hypothetical protein